MKDLEPDEFDMIEGVIEPLDHGEASLEAVITVLRGGEEFALKEGPISEAWSVEQLSNRVQWQKSKAKNFSVLTEEIQEHAKKLPEVNAVALFIGLLPELQYHLDDLGTQTINHTRAFEQLPALHGYPECFRDSLVVLVGEVEMGRRILADWQTSSDRAKWGRYHQAFSRSLECYALHLHNYRQDLDGTMKELTGVRNHETIKEEAIGRLRTTPHSTIPN